MGRIKDILANIKVTIGLLVVIAGLVSWAINQRIQLYMLTKDIEVLQDAEKRRDNMLYGMNEIFDRKLKKHEELLIEIIISSDTDPTKKATLLIRLNK